jgi:hypothetical protein
VSRAAHGQYVQHALIDNESHACMQYAISAFKDENPGWDAMACSWRAKIWRSVPVAEGISSCSGSYLLVSLKEVSSNGDGQWWQVLVRHGQR